MRAGNLRELWRALRRKRCWRLPLPLASFRRCFLPRRGGRCSTPGAAGAAARPDWLVRRAGAGVRRGAACGPACLDGPDRCRMTGADRSAAGPPDRPSAACPFGFGGWAGLARSRRSSSGARSKRRMIAFISSVFGASINANPLDSCVSGLRITLIASATRFSAASQPLMSSAVTQAGRLPRKTVKLIRRLSSTP